MGLCSCSDRCPRDIDSTTTVESLQITEKKAAEAAEKKDASKSAKFNHLQLRSVLDSAGAEPDETWRKMIESGASLAHVDINAHVALPKTEPVEEGFLETLERLAESIESEESFSVFYRHFGWNSPEEYFGARGESQVMIVDVDRNDLDDRLAIILVCYQAASANSARRKSSPDSTCRVCLDSRTYEDTCAITVWRVLELAARLRQALTSYGLYIEPVFTNREQILELVVNYLNVPLKLEALEERVIGTGKLLFKEGAGGTRSSLIECCLDESRVTVWLLGGICPKQVADLEKLSLSTKIFMFEQAQPAWQSMDTKGSEVQPAWSFPPEPAVAEYGFGVEPSNVRSSDEAYAATVMNYMSFQSVAAHRKFHYVCVGLARHDGFLPVPPGKGMLRIAGRPLNVIPGEVHVIKKAVDMTRAERVFSRLMAAAQATRRDTIYKELCISVQDDAGTNRQMMNVVIRHGTFLADAIFVALASRPFEQLHCVEMVRRLAFMRLPPQ